MAYPSPRRLQLRRGNATAVSTYLGYAGELVVDTTNWTLYVHDGVTVGGYAATVNTASITGNISSILNGTAVFGNIIPSANTVYSLGNITHQWNDLFVSNNTIYVGGVPLGIDATGNLTVNGNVIPTINYVNTAVANVTVDLSSYALNANVTAANVGLKGYVDQANTIQSAQVNAANLAIVSANVGMKGYVDNAVASIVIPETYSNVNVAAYLTTEGYAKTTDITTANLGMKGYVDQANTIQSGQLASANLGIIGYVDQANTIQSQQISAANIGMKGYVDSQSYYSNTAVSTYLASHTDQTFGGNVTIQGNLNVNGNVTYISVNNVIIGDNIINLADLNPGDSLDLGFVAHRTPFGQPLQHTGLIRDASTNEWRLFSNVVPAPGATVDFTDAIYDDLVLGNITSPTITAINNNISAANAAIAFANTIQSEQIAAANVGIIGYINQGNTIQAAEITAANVGMKGYVDNAVSNIVIPVTYSNINVKAYTESMGFANYGNVNVAAYLSTNSYLTSATANLSLYAWNGNASGSYSNVQVATYLPTYSGNLSAGGYFGLAGADGTTVVDFQTGAATNQIITLSSNYTFSIKAGAAASNRGSLVLESGQNSRVKINGNGSNVLITAGNGTQSSTWTFANSGVLTFPDGTIQSTAASGGGSNYGNANVTAYTVTMGFTNYSNVNAKAYTESMGFANYSNVNVKAYTESMGFANYSNVNVKAYTESMGFQNYGNANVSSYLPSHTGNVGVNYLLGTTPNVTLTAGTFNSTFDTLGNVSMPNVYVSGNVVAGYFIGDGSQLTGLPSSYSNIQTAAYLNTTGYNLYSNVNVAAYMPGYLSSYTGNITAQNITVSGNINLTGNVLQINSAVFYGNTGTGFSALYAGAPGYTALPQVVAQFTTNYNGYAQLNSQNLGTGNQASTDFVATANNGTDSTYFVDLGIAGSGYDPAVAAANNALGTVISPNDAYLYISGNLATTTGGNLAIGTQTAGKVVRIFAGGVNAANVALTIANTGITTSNVSANYFIGSGQFLTGLPTAYSNVNVKAYTESMGFQNYGNVNVAALITTNGLTNYSNVNTAAYLNSQGYNLYSNVNVIAYLAGNITVGNVTATYFTGNGAFLTGLPAGYSNVQVAAYLNTNNYSPYSNVNVANYLTSATINTTGNITAAYLVGNISITGNVTGTSPNVTIQAGAYNSVFDNLGNVTFPKLFSTGNIQTAGYIFGNGSQLTGLPATYSNVQVATYLPTYTGVVTASNVAVNGNVTAQYLFGNGAFLTGIVSSSGGTNYSNVNVQAYTETMGFKNYSNTNVIAYLNATGYNLYSNVNVTSYLGTGQVTVSNIKLSPSGNIVFADGTVLNSAATIGGNYSNVNVAVYLPTYGGTIQSSNVQTTTANIQTTTAATNPATGALRVMGGVGVAGTVFAGQLNTTGNLVANAVTAYSLNTVANVVASVVSAGTINSAGNVLAQNIIGTIATASQTGITAVGTLATLSVTGNATVGNLVGTEANTRIIANVYTTTFDIYGNVTFPGNITVGGLGVTQPTRPAFRIIGAAGPVQSTSNVNIKSPQINVIYNQGGYFDSTTGKFTAPVAGLYHVDLVMRVGTNNGLNQFAVLRNGNNSSGNIVCFWESDTNTGTATHFGTSGTIQLAAGDYLSANILNGNGYFDGNDNWCVTYLG